MTVQTKIRSPLFAYTMSTHPSPASSSTLEEARNGAEKLGIEMEELGTDNDHVEKLQEVDLEDEETQYSAKEERAVLKKLDRRVVLFVAGLYLLSFLDRSSRCITSLKLDFILTGRRYWQCANSRS